MSIREGIAKRFAVARGLIPWERLPYKQTKECGAACKEDCLREADQILTYLKAEIEKMEGLSLTENELGGLEWNSATLNLSFMDDYPEEVKAVLEAQVAKVIQGILKLLEEK